MIAEHVDYMKAKKSQLPTVYVLPWQRRGFYSSYPNKRQDYTKGNSISISNRCNAKHMINQAFMLFMIPILEQGQHLTYLGSTK